MTSGEFADYDRIMNEVSRLEEEHFKEPCDPTRCSHLAALDGPPRDA